MTNLVAILIVTNLVRVACPCGWCTNGVVIPEHVNRIGYDLRYEVTTNYLPIVQKEVKKND